MVYLQWKGTKKASCDKDTIEKKGFHWKKKK
jgi:hypothetical protein